MPFAPRWRYELSRRVLSTGIRAYSRLQVEGVDRLPAGPVVLVFNHLDWADPLFFMAALAGERRLFFFGPEEENMRHGGRNRLMRWAGIAVPFKPGRRGLISATRRVHEVLDAGGALAIAGEGRIHAGERELLPLNAGAAYYAISTGTPLVPLAINGTSWLGFRDEVRVKVGPPIMPPPLRFGRVRQDDVERLTQAASSELKAMTADFCDKPRSGLIGRWLTELFNDWPEGARPPH